jgi:site-specific recombinase XerC
VDPVRNTESIAEYLNYLRVEKGLRPLTCAAYERDLLQFAEYLERENKRLVAADQRDAAGFLEHLRHHAVEARSIARKLPACADIINGCCETSAFRMILRSIWNHRMHGRCCRSHWLRLR